VEHNAAPQVERKKDERLLADAFVVAQSCGKSAYNDVIKAFYQDRRVARIIHDRARAMRCLDDKEEVQQQVAILLSEKLLDDLCSRPNPPTAIYTLISTTTHFVCQTLMKQHIRSSERHVSLHPGDNLDQHFETLGISSPGLDLSEEVLDRVDQQTAQIEFYRRKALLMKNETETAPLHETHFLDQPDFGNPIPVPPSKTFIKGVSRAVSIKRSSPRKPSAKFDPDGQAKLVKIRDELHLTNQELAQAIGLRLATLSAYVYGRVVAGVPIVHIEAAQALLANGGATIRQRQQLAAKTQPEIIAEWERELGIYGRGDVDTILADLLKVNQVTVWRWKKPGGTVLNPAFLSKYTDIVRRMIAEGWQPPPPSVHNLPLPQIIDSWCTSLSIEGRADRLRLIADCIGVHPWQVTSMLVPGADRPTFRRLDDWFRRVQNAALESIPLVPLIDPTGMSGKQLIAAFEKALDLLPESAQADKALRTALRIPPRSIKELRSLETPPSETLARGCAILVNDRIRSDTRASNR
jgi:transcriptional regulator with XRE-family HTH domain